MSSRRAAGAGILAAVTVPLLTFFSGCGTVVQPLPAAIAGFSLQTLQDIQSDERLTDDERRQRIRDLVGAPNDDAGDRLVDFLLNVIVP
ncbi:MAG: hypothetical protein ACE5F9_04675 [Phycisphaerae bacterium]